jgi:hypothetical protein
MAHVISAVKGSENDLQKISTALLSVSDKSGLVDLGTFLHGLGVKVSMFEIILKFFQKHLH